jgi:pilus assembly protein CpaB
MIILIIGLSAGLTWLVTGELSKKPEQIIVAAPASKKTPVLICTHNLEEGSVISSEDVETQMVDSERAPIDALNGPEAVVGRSVKFPIAAGSLISTRDLAPMALTQGFQSKLHPGERAVTFAVDTSTGVAGFVTPDSHVDVMIQIGSGAESKTHAILSDVRVVASGTTYQKVPGQSEAQPTGSVTVAVDPRDAAKLINSMAAGKLYLALRSDRDHTPIAVVDVNSLFRKPRPATELVSLQIPEPPRPDTARLDLPPLPEVKPPTLRTYDVEQYAGTNRNVTTFRQ